MTSGFTPKQLDELKAMIHKAVHEAFVKFIGSPPSTAPPASPPAAVALEYLLLLLLHCQQ